MKKIPKEGLIKPKEHVFPCSGSRKKNPCVRFDGKPPDRSATVPTARSRTDPGVSDGGGCV